MTNQTFKTIIYVFSITFLTISFLRGYFILDSQTNDDLRNRVVGARLILNNMNPYYFTWEKGMSETLIDPLATINSPHTRVTVTPLALTLHMPFANLNYVTQKTIWFFAEWAVYIATITLFTVTTKSQPKQLLVIFLGSLFSLSQAWHYHIASGQIYIFYTFLVALSYYLSLKSKNSLLAIILLCALILLRPIYLVFIIPFVITKKQYINKIFIGLMCTFLLSLVIFDVTLWKNYVDITLVHSSKDLNRQVRVLEESYYPEIIEGQKAPSVISYFDQRDSSIRGFVSKKFEYNIQAPYLIITYILIIFTISLYLYKVRNKINSHEKKYLIGSLLIIFTEFFVPVSRYPYNNVQLLPIFFLITLLLPLQIKSNSRTKKFSQS